MDSSASRAATQGLTTGSQAVASPASEKPSKAVQIADPGTFQFAEAESWHKEEPTSKKQYRAGLGDRRLSGRMPAMSSLSLTSPALGPTALETPIPDHSIGPNLPGQASDDGATALTSNTAGSGATLGTGIAYSHHNSIKTSQHSHRSRVPKVTERLLAQVAEWLDHEKAKAERRKLSAHVPRRRSPRSSNNDVSSSTNNASSTPIITTESPTSAIHIRSNSMDSQASDDVSLDRLQRIIEDTVSNLGLAQIPAFTPRLGRRPSRRRLLVRTNSSDTEYTDGDVVVPSCDGVLDVSKTLAYSGGQASSSSSETISKHKEKEHQAWISFKNEIIRLTHTLKLKGWRRVPLDSGDLISVERISGALTNAVYMVSPPTELPQDSSASPSMMPLRKPPPKLLLRVYGPQVEALIDRETELAVLRRLARKRIGPRLLGTFQNGRFEEFLNAITLRPQNLREPETSRQIAKRMRELHEGIDLLPAERLGGPAVFNNWNKWQETVEQNIKALDKKYDAFKASGGTAGSPTPDTWMTNGYVCGVEWPVFCDMVKKHREYVNKAYGSKQRLQEALAFCHNDTQYGNILRIEPDNQKSPLLQPANKHKQLAVIDFEYAAANVPGLDIANHFTEWAYNYHDPVAPYKCNAEVYPTREEQLRFIRAYVEHQPQFPHSGTTPRMTPLDSLTNTPHLGPISSAASIVDFMLDARSVTAPAPSVGAGIVGLTSASKEDLSLSSLGTRDEESEVRVKELYDESILWRAANSAQWVAWGIVQAKVSVSEEDSLAKGEGLNVSVAAAVEEEKKSENGEEDEDEAFDYLGYAQDRAMFFWGDCVVLGLVKKEDLPENLQKRIKIVRS
ncbi:hypothetical protein Cpir12675_005636 [Ceratocystis pirilliformis]|uniref:Choline kinase N-terminal domain-containing protein n=1 Tax=Ceratocystis pirilliformis TaxID=259994 RepID=A0ABR3YN98_9PEZI